MLHYYACWNEQYRYGHFMVSHLLRIPFPATSTNPMLLPLVRHVSKPQSKQRCLAAWGRTISTTPEPHAYLRPLLTTTADAKLPELDRVMTLMLNRPATKNALTVQMVSVCALIICIASLCIILSMSFVCRRCVRPWPP